MHLHRNSLIYRLRRIAEVAGVNLDDAEDRFNLQLALKLMPLLDSSALILNPDCEVSYCAF